MTNFSISSMRSTCTPFVHGSSDHLSSTAPAGMESCSCTASPLTSDYLDALGGHFGPLFSFRVSPGVLLATKHNRGKANFSEMIASNPSNDLVHFAPVGTRRFNSSNQFSTTFICVGA